VRVGFETGRIFFSVQIGSDNQAGMGTGGANEAEHFFIAVQWLGSPVLGDLGEQTMLDGIPFGGAGGIVSDGHGEAEGIAQLSLDFGLPGPGTATVAAARVRQNQQLANTAPAARTFAFPPGGNGMGGEGRRVMRDADADGAAVVRRVVNAAGDADATGVGAEVVIVHPNGRAIPFGSGILEVADQLAFLAVDADDRKALSLKASPQRADMLELLIAAGTGVGGDLLAVDTEREIHLVQKTSDRIGRDRDVDLLKDLGDLLRRLAGPLQPGDGISGGIVLQKDLDGVDYFGRFFPTDLRPPPDLRARSTSTSWANHCCRPRATV